MHFEQDEMIFHKMLDAVPISMLMMDQNGKIVFANRFTEQVFGYEQQQLLGKTIEELIPERFRNVHPKYREQYMALPKIRSMGIGRELFGLRIDGSEVPVEIGLTPIRIKSGFFVLASIVDVSERKTVGEQLIIKEKEKKLLDDVNLKLAEFAHTVGHDLTDPLLKIETFLPILLSKTNDSSVEVSHAVDIISKSIDGGKKLIKDLLDFAQSSHVNCASVDLQLLVKEICDFYSESNLDIKFTITNIPKSINADEILIRQLFSNLIGNAVKFQKSDCVDKFVEVGYENGSFFVKDNGIGIAEENLTNIFKPFYRVSKNKYKGTGLGLSICKKIVENHEGKIWLESKLGAGTTLFFTICCPSELPSIK